MVYIELFYYQQIFPDIPSPCCEERKALREKIEAQCKSFDGKGKLTVDDLYNVLKLQVDSPSYYSTSINIEYLDESRCVQR